MSNSAEDKYCSIKGIAMSDNRITYADDDSTSLKRLVKMRFPSLLTGLILGTLLSFLTSQFEEVLSKNIRVVFFLPFIVYMADAVGTQTENIYSRDLRSGKASFKNYLIKETLLGLILGLIFSVISFLIVLFWFDGRELAIVSAPLIALLVTEALELEHTDPAVGAGPLATVIQDTVSLLIYGLIATAIII
ncbi:magnesium transporter [Candidatus Peregrinibacteria bacterium]|nr:magnesium transporter [Candidatus Peregrinibacteria bacterium]